MQSPLPKKYVSVDIESSGSTPGKYSMLSLGSCIVGDTGVQFYRELKPLNTNYVLEAMRVGCLGLECLKGYEGIPQLSPSHPDFKPGRVLELLAEVGEEPTKAMADYADWIISSTKGFQPVETARPIKFDGMFTAWYFDNFYPGENPLGFKGEDMGSFYRGLTRDRYNSIKNIGVPDDRITPHNALEDAVYQAKLFERLLELLDSSR